MILQDEECDKRRADNDYRDRTLGARRDREPDESGAGKDRAHDITGARPALTLLGEIANQRGDRQIVRPTQWQDRKSQRRQKPVGEPERDHTRVDRGRKGNRQEIGEEAVDDEGYDHAERGARESAGEGDDQELDESERNDARSARADRL